VKKAWNKNELKKWFSDSLNGHLPVSEVDNIFFRLLADEGLSRLDWACQVEIIIEQKKWNDYISALQVDMPIQYILGYEWFNNLKFKVNEHVLIPRPETAELVEWIIKDNMHSGVSVLDIGTGSGCIAITLDAALDAARITATDISDKALQVAMANNASLGRNVTFRQDDILNTRLNARDFDIIVSNPPYIPLNEASVLEKRVLDFEPHLALFSDEDDPLRFYKAILAFALPKLQSGGRLYFEAHEDYAHDVAKLAQLNNCQARINKDMFGKNRMMKISA